MVADHSAIVSVGVLGPRHATGPAKLRPRELEVFLFLAVNRDRPLTNDDIRAAVAGAVDDESNANTVRTWLSRIRAAVGPDVLPEAEYGRYRLTNVDTDIAASSMSPPRPRPAPTRPSPSRSSRRPSAWSGADLSKASTTAGSR